MYGFFVQLCLEQMKIHMYIYQVYFGHVWITFNFYYMQLTLNMFDCFNCITVLHFNKYNYFHLQ